MFARAQEPFQDLIAAEIAAEEAEARQVEPVEEPTEAAGASGDGWVNPTAAIAREEEAIRKLEDALFG